MRRAPTMALCGMLLCAACAGGNEISGERRNIGGVTVTFRIEPSRPRAGQAVRLTLRLVNNTGNAERLTFPSSQKYDFWVTRDGDELWRWSDDQVFAQQITYQTIEGQGSAVFDETWTVEGQGTLVAHGALEAEGYGGELTGELVVG